MAKAKEEGVLYAGCLKSGQPGQGCGEGEGRGCTVHGWLEVRSARSGLWRRRRKRVCALQVFEIQEQGEVSR